jgi:hypothetical protein
MEEAEAMLDSKNKSKENLNGELGCINTIEY